MLEVYLVVWSHGTNHKNYNIKKYGTLYDEVVNSKKEIEAQNIKVAGFVLPGVAPSTGQAPLYNGLTNPGDYNSPAGKLLMETYAITEAYAYRSSTRILPTYIYHNITLSLYRSAGASIDFDDISIKKI